MSNIVGQISSVRDSAVSNTAGTRLHITQHTKNILRLEFNSPSFIMLASKDDLDKVVTFFQSTANNATTAELTINSVGGQDIPIKFNAAYHGTGLSIGLHFSERSVYYNFHAFVHLMKALLA